MIFNIKVHLIILAKNNSCLYFIGAENDVILLACTYRGSKISESVTLL